MYRRLPYKRVKLSLDFLQLINGQPQLLVKCIIAKKAMDSLFTASNAQEVLQAMFFYSWL